MLLAQGQIYAKIWLFMCVLAVLGSQGVVVKCTATIFFRTVDCTQMSIDAREDSGVGGLTRELIRSLCDFFTLHSFPRIFYAGEKVRLRGEKYN